jgi:hypothetical protein
MQSSNYKHNWTKNTKKKQFTLVDKNTYGGIEPFKLAIIAQVTYKTTNST